MTSKSMVPRTKAGQDMLRRHMAANPAEWLQTPWDVARAIVAIENEAAAQRFNEQGMELPPADGDAFADGGPEA